ncbi:MAG: response regulator [Candidatus Obscuribacterales bacterium]|nr:response regulator [Cyanobacteria bacterium SZAS LIN-5]RTL40702.1 MAG: response regulator [Candidatus Melainabacteria bacterium]
MGKNILLLDDDKQFCKLMASVLEGRGHKVLQADSGEKAWETLNKENLDLVIVCGPLPDKSGVDWISEVRAKGNDIRCVFVGQSQKDVQINKSKLENELGISLIVHKPVIPFVFGAQIEGQFAESASAQAGKLKDFETMFLALVTKYAHLLPTKLNDLSAAIQKAKADPNNKDLVGEVRAQAHKIKGTGGSLGFRMVGEAMAFIEQAAVAMPSKSHEEQQISWAEIDRKLIEAQAAGEMEAREVASVVAGKDEGSSAEHEPAMARILVVDSDQEFLNLIEDLGRERLVEIVKALNVTEALNKACLLPLDAALVNVVQDSAEESFKLARQLRELPGYENLPLAFISGDAIGKDRVEAAHAGASLYLDKPLQSDSLETAVQHLVAIRQGGRPRILITDDDEFFANTVALTLRNEGMIVRTLLDPTKILDVMQDFPPDMLLLDVMMPGITGFEVCRMLRQVPRWQDLPIIFLTGQTGVDARVEAFRSGGDDYLPKPVVNEELLTRVKVRLDRSKLLKERSDKDTITGLLLRRAFSEHLTGMIAEAQRTNSGFSVCLLDVDHFKKVNDTYGHLAGDKVLAGLGQLLSRRFRVDDLRGRWGGEEFILAFRREAKETMHAAVLRVLDEFSDMTFVSDEGKEFHVSFSGGLATFPEDGESVYDLLQTADRRLYEAKRAGRRRIVLNDPDPAAVPTTT